VRRFDSLHGLFRLCRTAALPGADTRLGGAAGSLRIGLDSVSVKLLSLSMLVSVGLLGFSVPVLASVGLLGLSGPVLVSGSLDSLRLVRFWEALPVMGGSSVPLSEASC
jgi:hypothetical protein